MVVPNNVRLVIEHGLEEMPHITGMMHSNVFGCGHPPFIILEELKNLPIERKLFSDAGLVSVGSTPSRYMTRDLFVIWALHFIIWLMEYRIKLQPHLRTGKALLIMDGHSSRECPLAMLLFRQANIHVLILLAHATHVLLWFDVGLAAPLKQTY